MDSLLIPILFATVAGLLAWGVVLFIQGFSDFDKKKLAERLGTGDDRVDPNNTRRSIVMAQMQSSGLPAGMADKAIFQNLHSTLLQAYPEVRMLRFLTLAAVLLTTFLLGGLFFTNSLIIGVAAGAFGGYMPFFVINSKRSKRQKALANQLPDALDFLSRILKAGHSLTTGLQMMGEELPAPIGSEFRRCYDQHSLGQPLEESLKDASTRIESTDFAFFITAVLIQRQTGGDLSEVLSNISGMIRQRIRLQQHVKAKTAEGRFTGYILVAFPAVMFVVGYVMNPTQFGILLTTTSGNKLLGTAFGLQMLGLWAIRKITTVNV